MEAEDRPYSRTPEGIRLWLRLTPRASRDALEGIVRDAHGRPLLQLRIKAPPVEGAANKALVTFVAKALKLGKGSIDLVSGTKGRMKTLQLSGDPEDLERRVDRWIAQAE